MSSGIGFNELIVLFIIGLLILGPERLPRVATQIGRWVGRARRTANQLRYQLEREIALADIEKKSKDRREPDKPSSKPRSGPDGDARKDKDNDAEETVIPEESIAGEAPTAKDQTTGEPAGESPDEPKKDG